jgi:hypothetical protein
MAEETSRLIATCPFFLASALFLGVAFSVLSCPAVSAIYYRLKGSIEWICPPTLFEAISKGAPLKI